MAGRQGLEKTLWVHVSDGIHSGKRTGSPGHCVAPGLEESRRKQN